MIGESRGKEPTNPNAVRAVEAGKNWEGREEHLFEKIERDIRFFENIYEEILTIPPSMDEELLTITFNRLKRETVKHFPYSETHHTSSKDALADIDRAISRVKSTDFRELQSLLNEKAYMLKERKNLENVWLKELTQGTPTNRILDTLTELDKKFWRVRQLASVKSDVNKYIPVPNNVKQHIYGVTFEAFEIKVQVDDAVFQAFGRQPGTTNGLHIAGSPFSLIHRVLPEKRRPKTERHESIHNILDGAYLPRGHQSSIQKRIENFQTLNKLPSPTPEEQRTKSDAYMFFHKLRSADLLQGLQEELLAEIRNIEDIGLWPATGSPESDFNFATARLSTAGTEARLLANEFANQKDTPLGPKLQKLQQTFIRDFNRMVRGLVKTFATAKKYGEEADMMAHMGMLVLPPNKYHHLPKLLERRYGAQSLQRREDQEERLAAK